jgi:hypothetical protein
MSRLFVVVACGGASAAYLDLGSAAVTRPAARSRRPWAPLLLQSFPEGDDDDAAGEAPAGEVCATTAPPSPSPIARASAVRSR